MKLMTGILAVAMMTGGVWAQNPNIINNVKGKMDAIQQQKADGSNAALSAAGVPATAQATKPAAGASAKPGTVKPVPVKAAAAKPVSPTASKSAVATKTATSASAKPVPVKAAAAPVPQRHRAPAIAAAKPHDIFAPKKAAIAPSASATKLTAQKGKAAVPTMKIAAAERKDEIAKSPEAPKPPKAEEKKWAMTGKRDPFFSPVVAQSTGAGCSTGKKCLEIGQINVRGVVKSESGFIAVVTNSLNKAYFLHENDPVFNGYVIRITGDSVVFQETVQDKLGKPLTREVVKRIVTPAV